MWNNNYNKKITLFFNDNNVDYKLHAFGVFLSFYTSMSHHEGV